MIVVAGPVRKLPCHTLTIECTSAASNRHSTDQQRTALTSSGILSRSLNLGRADLFCFRLAKLSQMSGVVAFLAYLLRGSLGGPLRLEEGFR